MMIEASIGKETTYGAMEANAVDAVFVSLPFVWNQLRTVKARSISHEMPD